MLFQMSRYMQIEGIKIVVSKSEEMSKIKTMSSSDIVQYRIVKGLDQVVWCVQQQLYSVGVFVVVTSLMKQSKGILYYTP